MPARMIQAENTDLLPEFDTVWHLLDRILKNLQGFIMLFHVFVEQERPQQVSIYESRIKCRNQLKRNFDPVPETAVRVCIHLYPEKVGSQLGKTQFAQQQYKTRGNRRVLACVVVSVRMFMRIVAVLMVVIGMLVAFAVRVGAERKRHAGGWLFADFKLITRDTGDIKRNWFYNFCRVRSCCVFVPAGVVVFVVSIRAGSGTAGADRARSICGQVMFVFMVVFAFFGVIMCFVGRMCVTCDVIIFMSILVMFFMNRLGF